MTRSMTLTALLLAAGTLLGTGCVAQQSHDDLLSVNRQLEERRVALEQQLAERDQTIADLQSSLRSMEDQGEANQALRARLSEEQAEVARLEREIEALQNELAELGSQQDEIVVVSGLPQEVSDALADLAEANPDLMTYDEARGMIRLKSDLTFGLGSADVNDNATRALARLAEVLNSSAASRFDVQVIGHTDAVPVKSARGRQLFIDNRGLSTNRGDAVARVLVENRVDASRIMSGGRGATQPIAENDERGRSQANRRVEIFLVKSADAGDPQPRRGGARDEARDAPEAAPEEGGVIEGEPEAPDDSVFK